MNSIKYNRTPHFMWSKGCTNDDKIASNISKLINNSIVITEKYDGSNTSLEHSGCFARTHAGPPTHESFDELKAMYASLKWKIPEGIQLFGEYCFALHSIKYDSLPGYFLLFNVRNLETMMWSSWDEVEMWAEEMTLPTVSVLFKGSVSSEKELQNLVESLMVQASVSGSTREGVVVRLANEFHNDDFASCVIKCVRQGHVQTSTHWKNQSIVKNILAK